MKNFQKFTLSMEDAVDNYLLLNAPITSTLPNFGPLFRTYSENRIRIKILSGLQETDKTGISQYKENLKNSVLEQALDISRKVMAFARITENTMLAGEVDITKTELHKAGGNQFRNLVLLLYEKALAHLADLGPYGITSDMLTAYKADIDRFGDALPKTRLGITEKKQATEQLALLFAANDLLLEKIDALVEIVRLTQPEFYAGYRNNRKVIVTGKSALAMTARITDAVTREGIRGVHVSFIPQNGNLNAPAAKAEVALVKVTAKKGIFRVKNLKPGTYNAILSKPGYKEQTVSVLVAPGEKAELTAELERV